MAYNKIAGEGTNKYTATGTDVVQYSVRRKPAVPGLIHHLKITRRAGQLMDVNDRNRMERKLLRK